MSANPLGPIDGTSSERSRRVYLARNLLLIVPALAIMAAATVAAAGASAGWPLGGAAPATVAAPADLGRSVPRPTATGDEAAAPAVQPERSTIRVQPAPLAAARLVPGPVERIIDTRRDGEDPLGADGAEGPDATTTRLPLPTPDSSVTGLVLSVSLLGATDAGTVTVEGSFGSLDVLTAIAPGAITTTGVIVVPGTDPSWLVNPTGGDLVVDLVGRFIASGPSSDGRLISVEPIRLAHLVTATDGREIEIDLRSADLGGAEAEVSAVLVTITADVGDDGGRIGIGPTVDALDQTLMWGGPSTANRQQSGVALVAPGDDGSLAIRYDGGSVLDVDLVAYVTGPGAPVASEGLFVPASSVSTIDRVFAGGTTVVEVAPPGASAAFVALRAAPGAGIEPQPAELARDLTVASGRTIGTVLPVGPDPAGGAGVIVTSATELQARLQVVGHFLAPTP